MDISSFHHPTTKPQSKLHIAHKIITMCSVYLPPRNNFNFIPKYLQDLIDQLPSSFNLMGHFNGQNTLWGCEEVIKR